MSHKKRDWSKYNKSLVNRGSITFWIDQKAVKAWKAQRQNRKVGRPFKFSDNAILTAATIRYVFNLSLRVCEGVIRSLFKLMKVPLETPCYTQICKRMKKIDLPSHLLTGRAVKHVVIDATGLKVFGEGEWKVKKHGAASRRRWKKLHIAVDENTQEILFADITDEYIPDTKFIPEIILKRKGVERVMMDGAADSFDLYRSLWESNVDLLTPPKRTGRMRREPWLQKRNKRLLELLGLGGDQTARSIWGKLTGYSKRATVESAIARWKRLFGYHLKSRCLENQRYEVAQKAHILNEMKRLESQIA